MTILYNGNKGAGLKLSVTAKKTTSEYILCDIQELNTHKEIPKRASFTIIFMYTDSKEVQT